MVRAGRTILEFWNPNVLTDSQYKLQAIRVITDPVYNVFTVITYFFLGPDSR